MCYNTLQMIFDQLCLNNIQHFNSSFFPFSLQKGREVGWMGFFTSCLAQCHCLGNVPGAGSPPCQRTVGQRVNNAAACRETDCLYTKILVIRTCGQFGIEQSSMEQFSSTAS